MMAVEQAVNALQLKAVTCNYVVACAQSLIKVTPSDRTAHELCPLVSPSFKALLESESTSLALLQHLLTVLSLAAPFLVPQPSPTSAATTPSVPAPAHTTPASAPTSGASAAPLQPEVAAWSGSRFTDLVDLLLGWWLDPALTPPHRCVRIQARAHGHGLCR